ncbi:RNA 2',3'-cyclic phosphodiesterase [Dongshaea marina]|uniref:RNA 2',3'-cyclic phosphodiesterase n=1 Tax=Dongshaea marina TaxID=2047966 RepID=UPI000D3ECCD9|nr:RNA 2',3'-cyclic phosphodiesterase [Dongshaea marina]
MSQGSARILPSSVTDATLGGSKRLFFGLSLSQISRPLQLLQKQLVSSGRAVHPDNFHLTLAFLGMTPENRLAELDQLAKQLAGTPFEITLDTLGHFKKARVLWIGPGDLPAPLELLASTLARRISELGIHVDWRTPYRPHATLYRKWQGALPELEIPPIRVKIDAFSLFESRSFPEGVRYLELARYPLQEHS